MTKQELRAKIEKILWANYVGQVQSGAMCKDKTWESLIDKLVALFEEVKE